MSPLVSWLLLAGIAVVAWLVLAPFVFAPGRQNRDHR